MVRAEEWCISGFELETCEKPLGRWKDNIKKEFSRNRTGTWNGLIWPATGLGAGFFEHLYVF
jgi:hypothetical protein